MAAARDNVFLAAAAAVGHGARFATMKRLATLFLLTVLAAAFSGCALARRKDAKPKESSAISSEIEAGFRQRWVEKRAAELVAQGLAAEAARAQAAGEFAERYPYAQPAVRK